MAILGKITAEVLVGGQALQEYEDDDMEQDDPKLAVKYIEATSGANFTIRVSIPRSFKITSDAISLEVHLDGICVEAVLLDDDHFEMARSSFCHLFQGAEWEVDGEWFRQPFYFRDILLVQESSKPITTPIDRIGTISLKLYRMHELHEDTAVIDFTDLQSIKRVTELAEKSLKGVGLTHSAQLGEMQSCPPREDKAVDYTDGKESPFAVFTFKYRSRTTLQSMLFIPRTPSPVPLEDRPVTDLSLEEARELLMRQRTHIKSQLSAHPKREEQVKPERGIKRERDEEYEELLASAQAKKAKVYRPFAHGEVVDLDDD